MMKNFADWTADELTWLERRILSIQDTVGHHFPWCDAYMADVRLPCTCGMDAMRENRAFIVQMRSERAVEANHDRR